MIMIYEAEIEQTVMGKLFIEADNLEQAKQVAERCVQEAQNLVDDAGEPIEYWTVKLSEGGFVGECAGVVEPLFELTQLEVAGNIHENPELLEEK